MYDNRMVQRINIADGDVLWLVRGKETGRVCEVVKLPAAWIVARLPPDTSNQLGSYRVVPAEPPVGLPPALAAGFVVDRRDCIDLGMPHYGQPVNDAGTYAELAKQFGLDIPIKEPERIVKVLDAYAAGTISLNEARAALNLPPIEPPKRGREFI